MPVAEVLQSMVLGVVVLAAMLAIMSAVVTAVHTAWAFLGIVGMLGLAIPNSYVVSAPARGDVPWLAVCGYSGVILAIVRTFDDRSTGWRTSSGFWSSSQSAGT